MIPRVPVCSCTKPEWNHCASTQLYHTWMSPGYQYAALNPEWHLGYQYAALSALCDSQEPSTQLVRPCMTSSVPEPSSTSPVWHLGNQFSALPALYDTHCPYLPALYDTQGTSTQLYHPSLTHKGTSTQLCQSWMTPRVPVLSSTSPL